VNAPALPALPLLPLDDACVAEARRALAAEEAGVDPEDQEAVLRWLVVSRALPLALDALSVSSDAIGNARLLPPRIEGTLVVSGAALSGVAVVDEAKRVIEVRVAGGPISDELVDSDAPVLCRVVFPFVVDGEQASDGEVRLQRFGYGPTQRR
jgi:hypothetical protein